jgi:hypothetical protein
MTTDPRTLRSDDPIAIELTTAVKQGDVGRLTQLLSVDPGLAHCVVEGLKGGGRTLLHVFADWPGHNPNAAALVPMLAAVGTDLNAPAIRMWHRETPLHWAATARRWRRYRARRLVYRRWITFVLSRWLRSVGGGAAAGRARCPNSSLARSGARVISSNYAPRGSLSLPAT